MGDFKKWGRILLMGKWFWNGGTPLRIMINKLINVPSGKKKIDNLDVDKLKNFSENLKEISDVVSKVVVKNSKLTNKYESK